MKRIFLVRHGENRANLTKEFSHRLVDYPLTAKGRLQAAQTGESFAGRPVQALYSSPLKRALETAEIIGKRLKLPVTVIETLRELNVGELETWKDLGAAWREHNRILRAWEDGEHTLSFPGGEDYLGLWHRMSHSMAQVLQANHGGEAIVVGHGGMFTFTLLELCPGANPAVLELENANCSISEVEARFENGRPTGKLVRWASYSHLHGEAAALVSGSPENDDLETLNHSIPPEDL